jgi:SAM-dependent methyltransferase
MPFAVDIRRALRPWLTRRRRPDAKAGASEQAFKCSGHCPVCDSSVEFESPDSWFRDHLLCSNCGSLPRERALMRVIDLYFPRWRDAVIHESSPAKRGASIRLERECAQYMASQYEVGRASGSVVRGMRFENLESLSLADESIDVHVTQDVLEHVLHPKLVFQEIARTLAPGGMHIFTVPLVNKCSASRVRATSEGGRVVLLEPEQYHGSPAGRVLVTADWGFDICEHIFEACGLFTYLLHIDDLSQGIRAEYNEVLVTVKPRRDHAAGDSLSSSRAIANRT